MKKWIAVSFVSAAAGFLLLGFQNATVSRPIDVEIREGTVPSPLTMLYCTQNETTYGVPCSIRFSNYRERDRRALAISRYGIMGSGLVGKGKIYYAKNAAEFNQLEKVVKAGDEIVLRKGTWTNQALRLRANGTFERPVIIRPEADNAVLFNGTSSIWVSGQNVILYGLRFKYAVASRTNNVAVRVGIDAANPCHACIASRLWIYDFNFPKAEIDSFIAEYLEQYQLFQRGQATEPKADLRNFYVIVAGRDITIADSEFRHHRGFGVIISAGTILPDHMPMRLHVYRNYIADRPDVRQADWPSGLRNGFEALYIGGSGFLGKSAYSLIENNYVEKSDGEAELFTIKASDVIIKNNTFRDNLGSVTLRHADRVLVEGNYFIGGNRPTGTAGYGGVRVIGGGHWIVNNHFVGLRSDSETPQLSYLPLTFMAANAEDIVTANYEYSRATNNVISHNSFADCDFGVVLGLSYSKAKGYTLLPTKNIFVNNVFSNISQSPAFSLASAIDPAMANSTKTRKERMALAQEIFTQNVFRKNLFAGVPETGFEAYSAWVPAANNLTQSTPLVLSRGVVKLPKGSKAINASVSMPAHRRFWDQDGLKVIDTSDLGADELGNEGGYPRAPLWYSTLWTYF